MIVTFRYNFVNLSDNFASYYVIPFCLFLLGSFYCILLFYMLLIVSVSTNKYIYLLLVNKDVYIKLFISRMFVK